MNLVTIAALVFPLAATAQDLLRPPSAFCNGLAPLGIPTSGWKPSKENSKDWVCMSALIPFGTVKSGGMAGNIAFYVKSSAFDRADDVRLKININNPDERELAFTKLQSATVELFKALSLPLPTELRTALTQKTPRVIATSFGQVELRHQGGRIDSYLVILQSASILAAEKVAAKSGASDFNDCKRVVAQAAGYSHTLLSGDGIPTVEAGYKSFMLQGPNKDLFFCESQPGGRYKVKAALAGVFPFRYIAEGRF